MPNGFEPKTAFEGYVVGKLEAMSDRLSALPCKTQDERIRINEQKISKMEGKAAVFGNLGGIITYLFGKLFSGK